MNKLLTHIYLYSGIIAFCSFAGCSSFHKSGLNTLDISFNAPGCQFTYVDLSKDLTKDQKSDALEAFYAYFGEMSKEEAGDKGSDCGYTIAYDVEFPEKVKNLSRAQKKAGAVKVQDYRMRIYIYAKDLEEKKFFDGVIETDAILGSSKEVLKDMIKSLVEGVPMGYASRSKIEANLLIPNNF